MTQETLIIVILIIPRGPPRGPPTELIPRGAPMGVVPMGAPMGATTGVLVMHRGAPKGAPMGTVPMGVPRGLVLLMGAPNWLILGVLETLIQGSE